MRFKEMFSSRSLTSSKRVIICLLALLLASFILTESILAARNDQSQDKETTGSQEATQTAELNPATKAEDKVDYYLPYPGILPDHPLYWLKMVRDRVRLWLTQDSEARVERLLLYADKRVGAAEVLINGGKVDLGLTTASKAEKYLEQAIDELEKLKDQTKDEAKLVRLGEQLEKATLKHKEVLEGVLAKVPDQAKPAIEKAIEYSQRGYNRVLQVRERKLEKVMEKIEEGLDKGEDKLEKGVEKAEEAQEKAEEKTQAGAKEKGQTETEEETGGR